MTSRGESSGSAALRNRLRRVEGQVRGIAGMIETDRSCPEIVLQLQAARAALGRVQSEILKQHIVAGLRSASRSSAERNRSAAELAELLARLLP